MSYELTPLDVEDNAAVDLLLEMGDVNCWDLDTDIMDVFEVSSDDEDGQGLEQLELDQMAQPKQEPEEASEFQQEPWYENADIDTQVYDGMNMVNREYPDTVNSEDLDADNNEEQDTASDDHLDMRTGRSLQISTSNYVDITAGSYFDIVVSNELDIVVADSLNMGSANYVDIIIDNELEIVVSDDLEITTRNVVDISTGDHVDVDADDHVDIDADDHADMDAEDPVDVGVDDNVDMGAYNREDMGAYNREDMDAYNQEDMGAYNEEDMGAYNQEDMDAYNQEDMGAYNREDMGADDQMEMGADDHENMGTRRYLDVLVPSDQDIAVGDYLGIIVPRGNGSNNAGADDMEGAYGGANGGSDHAGGDGVEVIPCIVDESYLNIEQQLAQMDGNVTPTNDGESAEAMSPDQEGLLNRWSVVAPLVTSATVEVMRLCFARIYGNEYRIYEALDNHGYQMTSSEPYVIEGVSSVDELPDYYHLFNDYVHIFPYTSLPEYVKQMILDDTGADVVELLNNSDCLMGIDLVPDAELDIMCVGRREHLTLEFRSEVVAEEEPHSGINVFGEATRVTLMIHNTPLVLNNHAIQEMSHDPEMNIFFYVNSNSIYMLNGRILFEYADLGKHVLPINNVDLIPFSPSHNGTSSLWKVD